MIKRCKVERCGKVLPFYRSKYCNDKCAKIGHKEKGKNYRDKHRKPIEDAEVNCKYCHKEFTKTHPRQVQCPDCRNGKTKNKQPATAYYAIPRTKRPIPKCGISPNQLLLKQLKRKSLNQLRQIANQCKYVPFYTLKEIRLTRKGSLTYKQVKEITKFLDSK